MKNPHKWQFAPRFRRHAFGWRSDTPIQRIKEALAEIKLVARIDAPLAAEGAVKFLEKISPALEHVDSSSGAIGTAVNKAIEVMVPIIVHAQVEVRARQLWLSRLWQAVQADDIPYLEVLGDYWGELCVTPEIADSWATRFLPIVEHIWHDRSAHGFFAGTGICLASLYAAGRHEQLLALIDLAPYKMWHDRRWGVKALAALGKKAEAIKYAETTRGTNNPGWQVAQACEELLLSSGLADAAYDRYAIEANQGTTHLATFRAIVKKYPAKPPETVLRDLIASTPGAQGKWFAAAKDAGFFSIAIELANASPTDPRTLTRAARDFADKQPDFAMAAGLAALRWIAQGHGYEMTGADIFNARDAVMQAAKQAGVDIEMIIEQIKQIPLRLSPHNHYLRSIFTQL